MKDSAFQAIVGIVTLVAANAIVPFFTFSKSVEYTLLFLIVFSVGNLIVEKIRNFLTLPHVFWANVVVNGVINFLVFYFSNTLWGGLSVVPINIKSANYGFIALRPMQLDILGTILVGTIVVTLVYQIIIYLHQSK